MKKALGIIGIIIGIVGVLAGVAGILIHKTNKALCGLNFNLDEDFNTED